MKIQLTRNRKIAIGSLLLLLLVWLLWPDRTLARVKSLRQELADQSLAPEQREAKSRELRETMRNLTPEHRETLFADSRERGNQEMERFRQMSPAEKKKHLDEQINRQEEIRKRMQQRSPQPSGGQSPAGISGGRGRGQNRVPLTPEQQEQRRQQRLDRSTPKERELRDQYRKAMEQRRRERGLPANSGMPGRPGR
jgi:hypothetical protein